MTQQELEIKCELLEKRLKKIYEICNQYPHDIKGITAMAKIKTNCDPDYLEEDIKWRYNIDKQKGKNL